MISPRHLDSQCDVDTLTADLASNDPVIRETARESLVSLRTREVSRALVAKLADRRDQVRWEAAKALASIADPMTAPALVDTLEDENTDVRWVASEGLIALGKSGLLAVLKALTKRASSVPLCQGAAHVLRVYSHEDDNAKNILAPILTALSDWEPATSAPPAAYAAIEALAPGTEERH